MAGRCPPSLAPTAVAKRASARHWCQHRRHHWHSQNRKARRHLWHRARGVVAWLCFWHLPLLQSCRTPRTRLPQTHPRPLRHPAYCTSVRPLASAQAQPHPDTPAANVVRDAESSHRQGAHALRVRRRNSCERRTGSATGCCCATSAARARGRAAGATCGHHMQCQVIGCCTSQPCQQRHNLYGVEAGTETHTHTQTHTHTHRHTHTHSV